MSSRDVTTYRRDYLARLPDTLLFQLKRFMFMDGATVKLGGRLTFPNTLDMRPFTRQARALLFFVWFV